MPGDVARNARWSLATTVGKQALRMLGVVLVARLLGPDSYGVIGQAAVYLTLSMLLLDVGVGTAIVQKPDLNREDIGAATTMNLGLGLVVIALTWGFAPTVAGLMRTPELAGLLPVLSLGFALNALAVVPTALLVKRLALARLGSIETIATAVGVIAGITAAAMGADYWSLAYQIICRDLVLALLLLGATGVPHLRASRRSWATIGSFGASVLGTQMLQFMVRNGDDILVARYLGSAAMAFYTIGYRTVLLPLQVIGTAATRVTLPAFTRLRDDPGRLVGYYRATLETLVFVAAPVLALVIVNAPIALPMVFGDDWEKAVRPTQILAYSSLLTLLSASSNASVIYGLGKAKWGLYWQLCYAAPTFIGYAIGLRWGIVGVSTAVAIATTVRFFSQINIMISRLIPVTLRQVLASMLPGTTASFALAGAWLASSALLVNAASPFVRMVLATACGILAYVGVYRTIFSGHFTRQLSLVRELAGRRNVRPRSI